jgi:hypothetical protein
MNHNEESKQLTVISSRKEGRFRQDKAWQLHRLRTCGSRVLSLLFSVQDIRQLTSSRRCRGWLGGVFRPCGSNSTRHQILEAWRHRDRRRCHAQYSRHRNAWRRMQKARNRGVVWACTMMGCDGRMQDWRLQNKVRVGWRTAYFAERLHSAEMTNQEAWGGRKQWLLWGTACEHLHGKGGEKHERASLWTGFKQGTFQMSDQTSHFHVMFQRE